MPGWNTFPPGIHRPILTTAIERRRPVSYHPSSSQRHTRSPRRSPRPRRLSSKTTTTTTTRCFGRSSSAFLWKTPLKSAAAPPRSLLSRASSASKHHHQQIPSKSSSQTTRHETKERKRGRAFLFGCPIALSDSIPKHRKNKQNARLSSKHTKKRKRQNLLSPHDSLDARGCLSLALALALSLEVKVPEYSGLSKQKRASS